MKKLYFLLFTGIITFSANSQLAITEFMVNPDGSDSDREWIELYNYSRNPVNLRGWQIKGNGTYVIDIYPGDFFVPAGGYVILAENKTVFETEWLRNAPHPYVIDYDGTNFPLVNTIGIFDLGYDDDFGWVSNWKITYYDDDLSGKSTFMEEFSAISQRGYEWKINRSGNDTVILGGTTNYYIDYENSRTSPATLSTNGDVGTPFGGDYSQEAILLNPGTCESPHPLTCGQTFSGSNTSGDNNIYNYNCAAQNEYGAEVFHEFTITQTSDVVIDLTGLTADLDIHLLSANSCDGSGCISRNDNHIESDSLIAGTYFIAVDGFSTSYNTTSNYDLVVNCSVHVVTTSIFENNIADDIKVFPNPSTGFINISSQEHSITNINVRDMSGRVIIANQKTNFNNVNLENVTNGFYFIEIETNNGRAIKKVSILK